MTPRHSFLLGTHNTLDAAARPTMFADLLLFTEAVITAADRERFRRAGFALLVVRQQPDLAIAYRRSLFARAGAIGYHHVVDGDPLVTPNRGTAWLPLTYRPTRDPFTAMWAHRINAAFPPYVRGEPEFRRRMWREHTAFDLDLIARRRRVSTVAAGGDANTPEGVDAYPGSAERGHRFDRLALEPHHVHDAPRWQIGDAQYMTAIGSDHPRLRARVTRTSTR
jgi:hypothetical protein